MIAGVGGYIPQLGEQHAVPRSVSKDEARGRTDERDNSSLGHQETDVQSEH